jgi:hypothetical protein
MTPPLYSIHINLTDLKVRVSASCPFLLFVPPTPLDTLRLCYVFLLLCDLHGKRYPRRRNLYETYPVLPRV